MAYEDILKYFGEIPKQQPRKQNASNGSFLNSLGVGASSAQADEAQNIMDAVNQTQDAINAQNAEAPTQEVTDAVNNLEDQSYINPSMSGHVSLSTLLNSPERKQFENALLEQLQNQRGNADQYAKIAELMASQPGQVNLNPSLSYIQNATGSKFVLPEIQSPESRQNQMLAMLKQQQSNEDELSKNKVSALKALMDSREAVKLGMADARMTQKDDQMDRASHHRVVAAIKNPKTLEDVQNYKKLDRALNLTVNKEDLTPQDIHEFQQSIRGALGIKGTSGVTEREETYLKNAGWNVEAVKQFLSGEPAKIAKNAPLVQHLVRIAEGMKENINKNIQDQVAMASSGYESMYARRPDLAGDIDKLTGKVMNIATTSPQLKKAIKESAKPTPSKKDLNDEFAQLYRSK